MSDRRRYGVVYDPLYGDEDLEGVGHGGGGEKEIGRRSLEDTARTLSPAAAKLFLMVGGH